MATLSTHTASPLHPSRTPADPLASNRNAAIVPRGQRRRMASDSGMHDELVLIDQSQLRQRRWQQLQREMAAFSPLGKWRPVPGANHCIHLSHLSQPAVLADAIREAVQFIRNAKAKRASAAKQ